MSDDERKSLETDYIEHQHSMQVWWGNRDNKADWAEGIEQLSDDQLRKGIKDVQKQLRFEKTINYSWTGLKIIVGIFVGLGVLGLLIFGIRQLFGAFN
jgi:hypothetical protein